MFHVRCGLLVLACTVFLFLNGLITQELRNADASRPPELAGAAVGGQPRGSVPRAELYKGSFALRAANRSELVRGVVRMTFVSQDTGAAAVKLSTLSVAITAGDAAQSTSPLRADFLLRGVEVLGARKVTASGVSEPDAAGGLLGRGQPCPLDAVLDSGVHAFNGEITSVDCGFSVHLDLEAIDVQHIGQKVVHYAVWVNMLTIIQIQCFLSQMRHTDEGPSAARLSIVGIACQALMDAYDSFLHLSLSASTQYMFNTFAVISLFKFVLFALLEVRYLLVIWRQRHQDVLREGWDAVRRELAKVYSRFYGALVLGLIVIYNCLDDLNLIAVVFQAYWVPQILYDVWQGSKNSLHPRFLAGISITRALAPLYLWGCPSGVFSGDLYPRLAGSPSPKLCATVVILQVAQLAMMASQRILGPRWFVPRVCLPCVYDYHRRKAETLPDTDCLICMDELSVEDGLHKVITPCDHRFHSVCLQKWMDVKMECPTCRAALPPMS